MQDVDGVVGEPAARLVERSADEPGARIEGGGAAGELIDAVAVAAGMGIALPCIDGMQRRIREPEILGRLAKAEKGSAVMGAELDDGGRAQVGDEVVAEGEMAAPGGLAAEQGREPFKLKSGSCSVQVSFMASGSFRVETLLLPYEGNPPGRRGLVSFRPGRVN
ncbi:hypothetical protein NYE40_04940 [Paenibacillus sp. FSL W8-1187]|uniref:hypothetical protein n=1 Tax=Paenibacillus sp. FSL W8-1187 TaxID=2975339 RepID=UPI0030D709FA